MTFKTYEEAKEFALKYNENLWIFEDKNKSYSVIRDFAYSHYCNLGWIPMGRTIVKVECIDMFTGAEIEN